MPQDQAGQTGWQIPGTQLRMRSRGERQLQNQMDLSVLQQRLQQETMAKQHMLSQEQRAVQEVLMWFRGYESMPKERQERLREEGVVYLKRLGAIKTQSPALKEQIKGMQQHFSNPDGTMRIVPQKRPQTQLKDVADLAKLLPELIASDVLTEEQGAAMMQALRQQSGLGGVQPVSVPGAPQREERPGFLGIGSRSTTMPSREPPRREGLDTFQGPLGADMQHGGSIKFGQETERSLGLGSSWAGRGPGPLPRPQAGEAPRGRNMITSETGQRLSVDEYTILIVQARNPRGGDAARARLRALGFDARRWESEGSIPAHMFSPESQ